MNRTRLRSAPPIAGGFLASLLLVAACETPTSAPADPAMMPAFSVAAIHWGYTGEEGPEHWGDLDPSFATCSAGLAQSPIDITDAADAELPELRPRYGSSGFEIVNNGHTIQVNYDAGSTLEIGGDTYNLLQYHFHTPSEHTVDGEPFPMEMHLVHASAAGELAVLGVLMEEGDANEELEVVWSNMPQEEGVVTVPGSHNIADILPDLEAYRYSGSLTTPPCSEGVRWNVLDEPIEVSRHQIEQFAEIVHGLNARPVQALNGRLVTIDDD